MIKYGFFSLLLVFITFKVEAKKKTSTVLPNKGGSLSVSPNLSNKSETCPKDEVLLAKEVLAMELSGRRTALAKDKCFKSLKPKYIHSLKTRLDFVEKSSVKTVKSGRVKGLTYNKKYRMYDAQIELVGTDGKTFEDSFRFSRFGKPEKKRPSVGCALVASYPKKVYVLEKCMKNKN